MKKKLIHLASKSPRRSFLLEECGFDVEKISIDVDESYPSDLNVEDIAEYIAQQKANACINILTNNEIGVTADTIVALNNEILEKPKDEQQAKEMLGKLSGRSHKVYTGVCVIKNKIIESFTVVSEVHVDEISVDEMVYYIENYQPFDKAGSYGIQEWFGYVKINKIVGSYSNIMGLPMNELYRVLKMK